VDQVADESAKITTAFGKVGLRATSAPGIAGIGDGQRCAAALTAGIHLAGVGMNFINVCA
jgi:hypothetical protein